ncbi:GroES-like protein [Phaeosphaeriaceae sp. SRC1lsM3a]|nr:GroES-like protein [Stagonospora sp. SRC1lsM3a]
MSQAPENHGAWMPAPKVIPLEIQPTPYTAPGPGQLVVRNSALGINPVDWAKQMLGDVMLGYVKYPIILGEDVAGTVVAVGEGASRFRVGDRVLAIAAAIVSNNAAEGGFQNYTVVREWLTTPLPEHISFEQGCVLPLALLTASQGMFDKNYLGLDLPTVPARPTTAADGKSKRVVLIAGGASALGSTAIQLAKSAGYEVVSTASPKNFDYVQRLGASDVFDYKSESLADDLTAAVRDRQLCGCLSIGDGTADVFAEVLKSHVGPGPTSMRIARAEGKCNVESGGEVEVKFVINSITPDCPARPIFEDYLGKALAKRQFVPKPDPEVAGHGLEQIQDAFTVHKKGVSAKKIVVTL